MRTFNFRARNIGEEKYLSYTMGEDGLCLNCEVCHWPNCGFGHC